MWMKLKILVIFALLGQQIYSQRVSFGVDGGFLVSSANSFLGIQQNKVFTNDLSISNIRGSVGAGLTFGLDLGLQVNDYVSLHLAYADFFGTNSVFMHNELGGVYQHIEGKTTQHRFLPGVQFQIPGKKIDFFMRAALVSPWASETQLKRTESGVDGTANSYEMQYSINYKWSVGYQTSLGFSYKMGESFRLNLAVQSCLMDLLSKEKNMTSYKVNQVEQIDKLTAYDKKTIYRGDLNNFNNNADYNGLYDINKAKEELEYAQRFSALGLQVKIIYTFKNRNRAIKKTV